MKTIKRSTLRELTRLVRERAKHPEWSGRLWKEAVSVSMMLSRQATGNDSDIMEFAELANAIAGRFGIKPNCTDEEFEELFKWLGFEIDESEYGKYIDREAFLEHMKKTDRYFAVKYDIENFPSSDVDRPTKSQFKRMAAQMDYAPVEHGRWGDNGIPGSILSACSVCGFTCGASSFSYCPYCGAKMDDTDGE